MSPEDKPPSPYRGPPSQRLDKHQRERQRQHNPSPPAAAHRPARETRSAPYEDAPASRERASAKPPTEQRIYGLNACQAVFARRPEAIRKVWLLESRMQALKPVLSHCVKNRIGYTLVEAEDLERLSGSAHHEGVVFGALPTPELHLSSWLQGLAPGPQLALWLDGVGNPHNLGAILRSAAHFGVGALLLPKESGLAVSGAAARVAEGGAEFVPIVRLGRSDNSLDQLKAAGFIVAATVVRGGASLHKAKLPARTVFVLGAEQHGVDPALAMASLMQLEIPGRGAVESLNVASASSVLMSEWLRQHPASR